MEAASGWWHLTDRTRSGSAAGQPQPQQQRGGRLALAVPVFAADEGSTPPAVQPSRSSAVACLVQLAKNLRSQHFEPL